MLSLPREEKLTLTWAKMTCREIINDRQDIVSSITKQIISAVPPDTLSASDLDIRIPCNEFYIATLVVVVFLPEPTPFTAAELLQKLHEPWIFLTHAAQKIPATTIVASPADDDDEIPAHDSSRDVEIAIIATVVVFVVMACIGVAVYIRLHKSAESAKEESSHRPREVWA